jgi:hypothetical protein
MRTVASALVLILGALTAGGAHAQARLSLAWEAPTGCPDGAVVEAEVARLLGGEVPSDGPVITARAIARAQGSGLVLELRTEVDGVQGTRALTAERCDELAAATALILALMIDPEAMSRLEPEVTSTTPEEPVRQAASRALGLGSPRMPSEEPGTVHTTDPPREVRVTTEEPDDEPARTEDERLVGFAGAGFVTEVGTVPSIAPGVALEAGFGAPLVEGRVRAVFVFPQGATNEVELPGARAELMALSGGLLGCLRPLAELRFLGICTEVAAGAVFGSAQGISTPSFGAAFWLAAGGGLALTWSPVAWLDLELTGTVLGQIASSIFDVIVGSASGERRVVFWEPPGVTGRFTLAAHVRF